MSSAATLKIKPSQKLEQITAHDDGGDNTVLEERRQNGSANGTA
jgi:hypothetical protein